MRVFPIDLTHGLWAGAWSVRLLSIAFVSAIAYCLPHLEFYSVYWAVLFSHYVVALVVLKKVLVFQKAKVRAVAVGALGLLAIPAMYFEVPHIAIYFGLHHSFNEAYTPNRAHDIEDSSDSHLTYSRILLNLIAYIYLLSYSRHFLFFNEQQWLMIYIFTLLIFAFCFLFETVGGAKKKNREFKLSVAQLDILFFEAIGVVSTLLIVQVFKTRPRFEDIVFYHLMFWIIYGYLKACPTHKVPNFSEWNRAATYTAATLILFVVFFVFTPAAGLVRLFSFEQWLVGATALGHLHISLAILLSSSTPLLLRTLHR